MTKEAIYQYVKEQYGTTPEHLWKKDPKSAVLRHKNGKWYAVFMNVDKNKLGIPEEGSVDIMNVKCNPELTGFIARTYGIRPGYHMNKEHWISVVLDGSVGDGKTLDFLDMSYDLIDTGRK